MHKAEILSLMRSSGIDEKLYEKSICPRHIFCDFERITESDAGMLERCGSCGRREFYPKDNRGEVDQRRYAGDHLRDTLQPFGRTRKFFYMLYGHLPENRIKGEIERRAKRSNDKKKWENLRQELKEKNL